MRHFPTNPEAHFEPCLVAVDLIASALTDEDNRLLIEAAELAKARRKEHRAVMERVYQAQGEDRSVGMKIAELCADASADFVLRALAGDIPSLAETHILSPDRPDFTVATAMQSAFALLDGEARIRVKETAREVVRQAPALLADEAAYLLRLMDSHEAWELEMELDG